MIQHIPPEQMARYQRGARARLAQTQHDLTQRRARAWDVAREAARILIEEFGATRVVVYGSVAHGQWFRQHSDIDLAAEGIPHKLFWRAWVALDKLGPEFEINLIDCNEATDVLRESIAREGVELC